MKQSWPVKRMTKAKGRRKERKVQRKIRRKKTRRTRRERKERRAKVVMMMKKKKASNFNHQASSQKLMLQLKISQVKIPCYFMRSTNKFQD